MRLLLKQPWLPFLVLALVMQQANMLTYKGGSHLAPQYVFLTYSFLVQCLVNIGMLFLFRTNGFPVILRGKMRPYVLWVAFVYLCNEMIFITVYRLGAPYSLMMTIFALMAIIIMTSVGVLFLKEKISRRQCVGIALAMLAIVLIRLG
jgi:multidrug transporter EmrE-like cation transporter